MENKGSLALGTAPRYEVMWLATTSLRDARQNLWSVMDVYDVR